MSDSAREARRKKIRQLEASLFDRQDDVVTGLPELQRVDEYTARYGQAERKRSAIPHMKRQVAKEVKNIFFPDPRKQPAYQRFKSPGFSASDEEDLLESSGSSSHSNHHHHPTGDGSPFLLSPLPTPQLTGSRRKTLTTKNLLKSEVEELDHSIRHLVRDPKQEVIDNLRKRHAISRSPSVDGNAIINVVAGANDDLGLGRATTFLEQYERIESAQGEERKRRSSLGSSVVRNRESSTVDRSAKLLADEQVSLDQANLRRSSHSLPRSPEAITMPDIKVHLQQMTTTGRKESLQPLQLPEKKKSKRLSLNNALGMLSSGSSKLVFSSPFEDSLSRASRVPAVGKAVPMIKIDNSPQTKSGGGGGGGAHRNQQQQARQEEEKGGRRRGDRLQTPLSSRDSPTMVSFEGLERPYSAGPSDTFRDVPSDFHGLQQQNAFEDLPVDSTFHAIPSNVFEGIPSAVTEREARKMKRLQEERALQRNEMLVRKMLEVEEDSGGAAAAKKPSHAASLFLSQSGDGGGDVSAAPVLLQPTGAAVSLITALFPKTAAAAAQAGKAGKPGGQSQGQLEADFMFALLIRENDALNMNPTAAGPRPPPRPDPNDPEVGHFCAPFCAGFCEANFCIFHNPPAAAASILDQDQ